MDTTSPHATRSVQYLHLGDIPRASRNAKAHDLPSIRRSIETFGCTVAGVLDERTGRLVAGHGRLQALELMHDEGVSAPEGICTGEDGAWLVPIVRGWASRSDAEADAYVIADNRTGELGGWDDRLLAEVLDEVADHSPDLLEVTGYTGDDLSDLIGSLAAPPSLEDLERDHGEPGDDDLWPVLRFKVPPRTREDFYEITDGVGADDTSRFLWLIEQAKA